MKLVKKKKKGRANLWRTNLLNRTKFRTMAAVRSGHETTENSLDSISIKGNDEKQTKQKKKMFN